MSSRIEKRYSLLMGLSFQGECCLLLWAAPCSAVWPGRCLVLVPHEVPAWPYLVNIGGGDCSLSGI